MCPISSHSEANISKPLAQVRQLDSKALIWLIKSVKDVTKGPKTSSGQRQKNCRLFMDDLATTTETIPHTKYLLNEIAEKLNWAGLLAKPEKCRSLIIIKGEISKRTLELDGKPITSITEKPV